MSRTCEARDVVANLIGPVRPVGETNEDERRFNNLEELIGLTDELLGIIDDIAHNNYGHHQASRNKAGERCFNFFDALGIKE